MFDKFLGVRTRVPCAARKPMSQHQTNHVPNSWRLSWLPVVTHRCPKYVPRIALYTNDSYNTSNPHIHYHWVPWLWPKDFTLRKTSNASHSRATAVGVLLFPRNAHSCAHTHTQKLGKRVIDRRDIWALVVRGIHGDNTIALCSKTCNHLYVHTVFSVVVPCIAGRHDANQAGVTRLAELVWRGFTHLPERGTCKQTSRRVSILVLVLPVWVVYSYMLVHTYVLHPSMYTWS